MQLYQMMFNLAIIELPSRALAASSILGVFMHCQVMSVLPQPRKQQREKEKKRGGEGEFFSLPTASVKLNQTSIFHFVNQIPCFLVFTHPAKPKTAV